MKFLMNKYWYWLNYAFHSKIKIKQLKGKAFQFYIQGQVLIIYYSQTVLQVFNFWTVLCGQNISFLVIGNSVILMYSTVSAKM